MAALSLRLDPELEVRLAQEVKRRRTTKTQFVHELLRQALEPRHPVELLYALRSEYGLPKPNSAGATERSRNVKALVQQKVQAKHVRKTSVSAAKTGGQEAGLKRVRT